MSDKIVSDCAENGASLSWPLGSYIRIGRMPLSRSSKSPLAGPRETYNAANFTAPPAGSNGETNGKE